MPGQPPMTALPERFNLAEYYLFDRLAEGRGGRTAIRFGDRAWTFAEVAERTERVVAVLRAAGLRPGERVYLVLPDLPPFAWAFFATLRLGAVVTLGNPRSPTADLQGVVDYVQARVVITTPEVAEQLDVSAGRVWTVPHAATFDDPEASTGRADCLATAMAQITPCRTPADTHRDAQAIWLFTSGSTGRPKAAMHSHRDFGFNTEAYAKGTIGYHQDDVCVSVPRLYFGYATGTNLMFPFAVGACAALFSERATAAQVAWAVQHYQASVLTNVPTMMARLLEADAQGARVDLRSLRFSLSAGEALPPALLRRWQARFEAPVYDGIGSAEMFHIYLSNRPGDVKPGSLGRPVAGYTVALLPASATGPGGPEVAAGETGVLWVRGDSVAHGYWLNRDESWRTFHGHWCRSGDLFRRDAEGYYWFEGRADDLLKVGGQWVNPLEVEHCLAEHPRVVAAAVIGVWREGLCLSCAFIEARGGADEALAAELQGWVKARLARYKYPREVVFLDVLPRNDRGKVSKKALAALV
jgi:benzoate-CoA ligase family protein